jgi:hypothetical protein
MDVHVDQAGKQRCSGAVDQFGAVGYSPPTRTIFPPSTSTVVVATELFRVTACDGV